MVANPGLLDGFPGVLLEQQGIRADLNSIAGPRLRLLLPAAFLASIEEETRDSVAKFFDLIVGTSTGGIIALGLGLGFSSKELLDLYEQLGTTVFAGNRAWRALRSLV